MRTPFKSVVFLSAAIALSGCHPSFLNLVPPSVGGSAVGQSGYGPGAGEPEGYGGLNVAIKWPASLPRSVQAIPGAANTINLRVLRRDGTLLTQAFFNRPASTQNLVATASLPVHIGTSMLVQANAYREVATDSAGVPTADRIIAQGVQDNVSVTLNATTSVRLQLDPEVTVAGIGGTAALGYPPDPALIRNDALGPAYWTELLNPANLVFDRPGRYLYFTEDPDPGRITEGYRVFRLSMNATPSYGMMARVAGGTIVPANPDPDSFTAAYTSLTGVGGAAVDGAGNIYFSEAGTSNRVREIPSDGSNVSTYYRSGLSSPQGLLISGTSMFIADTASNRVRGIDMGSGGALYLNVGNSTAAATNSFVPAASVSITAPIAVALSSPSLFVAMSGGRLAEVNSNTGQGRTLVGGATGTPLSGGAGYGVTFGSLGGVAEANGAVFLTDPSNSALWAYNESTRNLTQISGFGGAGNALGQFRNPQGMAVLGSTLYVCDTGNNRIVSMPATDSPGVVAGGLATVVAASVGDVVDGTSSFTGTVDGPSALAPDGSGGLIVVDGTANRLRRLSFSGGRARLSTIAGYGNNGRVGQNVGQNAASLHLGAVAGLSLRPFQSAKQDTLYVLTNDTERSDRTVYAISGLNGLPASLNGFGAALPGVTSSVLFENMATRIGRQEVIDSPSSLAISADTSRWAVGMNGNFETIIGWDGVTRELCYPTADLPYAQGISFKVGTGAAGYNVDGPQGIIQINRPRSLHYDRQGNLYFLALNLQQAWVLRKVDPTGWTSTVAGGGTQAPPTLSGPGSPLRATLADLGTPAAIDIDSQGNLFIASGTKIYRYDQVAATLVEIYDSRNRTFQSIAYDEDDLAMYFTYSGEPKIKKIYFSRLF